MSRSLSPSPPHPAFFIFLFACGLVFILPQKYSVPSSRQARSLWSGEDLLCALCSGPAQLQSGLHDKSVTAPFIFD